jgi:cation transport regulator ChaC
VNSNRPVTGRSRGITFACDSTPRVGTCGQDGEAAGLAPAVLHSHFWDTASVAGADSRHTVNVAYRVRQRDPDAAVELIRSVVTIYRYFVDRFDEIRK